MAPGSERKATFSGRPSEPDAKGGRFWGWMIFSGVVHLVIILGLLVMPHIPGHRAVSYRAYTVDLVGGEKLGGAASTSMKAAPEPKNVQSEPAPQPKIEKKEARLEKKEKQKVPEKPVKVAEKTAPKIPDKAALSKSKPEVKKEERKEEGLSDEVRDKLIQAAVARVKERTATEPKKESGRSVSSNSGEDAGAAAPGIGGGGGGVVRGVEFINYLNRMRSVIRERWTWVGKRSDLEVKVRFGIQENGEIVGLKVVQRSGDGSYDDSVVRALRRASPLPPPPESYRKDFMDVELTFQPKDLGG